MVESIIISVIYRESINIQLKRKISEPDVPKLSIEQIRVYEGFENLSDPEAEEAVASILQLALILFNNQLLQQI